MKFLRSIFLISISLFFFACGMKTAKNHQFSMGYLVKEDNSTEIFNRAYALYRIGEIEAAVSVLRSWVDNRPYDISHDAAYELIVEWLFQIQSYEEAIHIASYFLSHHGQSPSAQKIIDLVDTYQTKPGLHELKKPPPDLTKEKETANLSKTLMTLERAVLESADENEAQSHLKVLSHFIFKEIPLASAMSIADEQNSSHISFAIANARLAHYFFHLGRVKESLRAADFAIKNVPFFLKEQLEILKQEIDEISAINAKSIGIILPLSGPYAALGQRALQAISIALKTTIEAQGREMFEVLADDLVIVVADSQGDSLKVKGIVDLLVKEKHVALILGDILPEASFLAAQKCRQYEVPMMSLSNNPLVPALGKEVFAFSATASQHINELVDHAMDKMGHKRFAILYPRHNYGILQSKLFFDAVIQKGGEISAIEAYDAHLTTFFNPIKKLVGMYYLEDREEYKQCEKDLEELEPAFEEENKEDKLSYLKKCKESLKPVIDFEALFIPEFKKLAFLIPALIQEDLLVTNEEEAKNAFSLSTKIADPKYVQLLGTSSWNNPSTLSNIAPKVSGAYFVDAISFSQGNRLKKFALEFETLTGSSPTSLEVFTHDAVILALKVLRRAARAGAFNIRATARDEIAKFNGRVGLLPNVSFDPNGILNAPSQGFLIKEGKAYPISSNT